MSALDRNILLKTLKDDTTEFALQDYETREVAIIRMKPEELELLADVLVKVAALARGTKRTDQTPVGNRDTERVGCSNPECCG